MNALRSEIGLMPAIRSEGLGLARYDAMCSAIAACVKVDEVKEIRDRARAFEIYAKQALNTDAERQAGEARLRAERKAGELLKAMKQNGTRQKPGDNAGAHRGVKRSSGGATTLSDLGVTRDQSSQWQQLADIPEKEFEEEVRAPGPKPTTEGLLAKRQPPVKKAPVPQMDPKVLDAWGWITNFKYHELAALEPAKLFPQMTDAMRMDVVALTPHLIAWLKKFGAIKWKAPRKESRP